MLAWILALGLFSKVTLAWDPAHLHPSTKAAITSVSSSKSLGAYINNCNIQDKRPDGTDYCKECFYRYVLSDDQKRCFSCENYLCLKCSENERDKCTTCREGYGVINGGCEYCKLNNCAECNGDLNRCNRCRDGFHLQNGRCVPCKSPCATCSDNVSFCLTCRQGFFLSNAAAGQCAACMENCEGCKNAEECTYCKTKFFVDKNKRCSSCIPNCDKCYDEVTCSSCSTGHFGETNSLCSPCYEDCDSCSSATKCSYCKSGMDVIISKEDGKEYCENRKRGILVIYMQILWIVGIPVALIFGCVYFCRRQAKKSSVEKNNAFQQLLAMQQTTQGTGGVVGGHYPPGFFTIPPGPPPSD